MHKAVQNVEIEVV